MNRTAPILLTFFLLLVLPSPGLAEEASKAAPPPRLDRLDMASGAIVLSQSSQYGTAKWSALALLDGTNKTGWCSKKSAPFPHEVLVELGQSALIDELDFDNTGTEESGYPGISARKVEVLASNTSPTEGFQKVWEGELKKGTANPIKLAKPFKARWLKLVVKSNWGHPQYTELMELTAYGKPVAGDPPQPKLSGVYNTNYNLMLFQPKGNQVTGCYDHGGGTLNGTTDGRVVQFEWREDNGTQVGTAIMVLSAKGDKVNGFWYEGGALQGNWVGTPAKPGQKPRCTVAADKSALETAITQSGRAITYGILFDVNSDNIKAASEPVLNEVLQLLKKQPKLALMIEGHTDSTSSDAYNLDLSQRRAQSVVKWLEAKGIPANRLTAKGYGESKPVADNSSAQGRGLNRRVELVRNSSAN